MSELENMGYDLHQEHSNVSREKYLQFKVCMKWKLSLSYLKDDSWNDKRTPSIVFSYRSSFLRYCDLFDIYCK